MKYKALVSFVGNFSMVQDEVKEITDEEIIKDLLNAGYIKPVEDAKDVKKEKEVKTEGVVENATPSKPKRKKSK